MLTPPHPDPDVSPLQKSRHTESEKLQVQIQAYLDNVFDVGGLLEDAETKTVALEKVEELEEQLSHVSAWGGGTYGGGGGKEGEWGVGGDMGGMVGQWEGVGGGMGDGGGANGGEVRGGMGGLEATGGVGGANGGQWGERGGQ